MAWVYLLLCADNSLYVGATTDLVGRLADHQAGKGGAFTSRRRPVVLVHGGGRRITEWLAEHRPDFLAYRRTGKLPQHVPAAG